MAFSVTLDRNFFNTQGNPTLGGWVTLDPQSVGEHPVAWSLKTEGSAADINTTDYFFAIREIMKLGDRIYVVQVTNRGQPNEAIVSIREHYIGAVSETSIKAETLTTTGGGDLLDGGTPGGGDGEILDGGAP
jgi:hypothetical protein